MDLVGEWRLTEKDGYCCSGGGSKWIVLLRWKQMDIFAMETERTKWTFLLRK